MNTAGRHAQDGQSRAARCCARRRRRALGEAAGQRLARRALVARRRTIRPNVAKAAGLGEVGRYQGHAVLAQPVEAGNGGAGAFVIDDARLEVAEHHRRLKVIGNARR